MSGLTIKVTCLGSPPFVIVRPQPEGVRAPPKWTGVDVQLVDILAEKLGFRPSYTFNARSTKMGS